MRVQGAGDFTRGVRICMLHDTRIPPVKLEARFNATDRLCRFVAGLVVSRTSAPLSGGPLKTTLRTHFRAILDRLAVTLQAFIGSLQRVAIKLTYLGYAVPSNRLVGAP